MLSVNEFGSLERVENITHSLSSLSPQNFESLLRNYRYLLIVLSLKLEVILWVSTYRAHLRSILAYVDVATVRALPDHIAVT